MPFQPYLPGLSDMSQRTQHWLNLHFPLHLRSKAQLPLALQGLSQLLPPLPTRLGEHLPLLHCLVHMHMPLLHYFISWLTKMDKTSEDGIHHYPSTLPCWSSWSQWKVTFILPYHISSYQPLFFFWLYSWYMEVSGPGMESEPQLWTTPQLWQCRILNSLCHSRNSSSNHSYRT